MLSAILTKIFRIAFGLRMDGTNLKAPLNDKERLKRVPMFRNEFHRILWRINSFNKMRNR